MKRRPIRNQYLALPKNELVMLLLLHYSQPTHEIGVLRTLQLDWLLEDYDMIYNRGQDDLFLRWVDPFRRQSRKRLLRASSFSNLSLFGFFATVSAFFFFFLPFFCFFSSSFESDDFSFILRKGVANTFTVFWHDK